MNADQLQILRHTLGLGADGKGRSYRNHFVTGEGSADFVGCLALTAAGLMVRHPPSPLSGGEDVFVATEAGKRAAVDGFQGSTASACARARLSDAVRAARQSVENLANAPNTTVNERLQAIEAVAKEVALMRDALLAHASALHIQREAPQPASAEVSP